ncbi:DUF401 family protein [Proteinivorax tanatarense]|uniref:DUF401 family protein n=1 Tax=Proteinivorax tanatarense TaxID=1260629 RepID=A0AAU7VL07_9FIRM
MVKYISIYYNEDNKKFSLIGEDWVGILGVIVSLILVVALSRKKVNIGLAMILGAVIVTATSGISYKEGLNIFIGVFVTPEFIELALVVLMISLLGFVMKQVGFLDTMISSLISLLGGTKLLMASIPSLIGLLTVPGGAALSAPMVGESGERLGLKKCQMGAINIFFRHMWFPIYPLYPPFLLVAAMTDVEIKHIILVSFPIVLSGVLVSFLTMFKGITPIKNNDKSESKSKVFGKFILSISPILLALILSLGFSLLFPIAIFIAVIWVLLIDAKDNLHSWQKPVKKIKKDILPGINYTLAITIFGIFFFKEILEASSVVEDLMLELQSLGLPLTLLVVLASGISGLVTGSNSAALGITIPIFASAIAYNPLPYVLLMFMTSLWAYVLSPIHLCLVLTKDYFDFDFFEFYKWFIQPGLAMTIVTVIIIYIMPYMMP